MSILFYCKGDDGQLLQTFRDRLPDYVIIDWQRDRAKADLSDITSAIVWMPPADFFEQTPRLQTVYAFSAGVDHLLQHAGLPAQVTIVRLRDAGMAQQMAEYALYGTLHSQRQLGLLRKAQNARRWAQQEVRAVSAANTHVGILGAGALGLQVAQRMVLNGYPVRCWSRSARLLENTRIACFHGEQGLGDFLGSCNVLICLLPLTEATSGILDKDLFDQLPKGAFLINPGRGAHLVEEHLLEALASGQISGALLDVFSLEPLPEEHPFWHHEDIIMTPHVAAQSLVDESVDQIVNSVRMVERGELPDGIVDIQRGY